MLRVDAGKIFSSFKIIRPMIRDVQRFASSLPLLRLSCLASCIRRIHETTNDCLLFFVTLSLSLDIYLYTQRPYLST